MQITYKIQHKICLKCNLSMTNSISLQLLSLHPVKKNKGRRKLLVKACFEWSFEVNLSGRMWNKNWNYEFESLSNEEMLKLLGDSIKYLVCLLGIFGFDFSSIRICNLGESFLGKINGSSITFWAVIDYGDHNTSTLAWLWNTLVGCSHTPDSIFLTTSCPVVP